MPFPSMSPVFWWGQPDTMPATVPATACPAGTTLPADHVAADGVVLAYDLPAALQQQAVPAAPELYPQLREARLIAALNPLTTLTLILLEPLLRQGVLLPKSLHLRACVPAQDQPADFDEAKAFLTGHFPLVWSTQTAADHLLTLELQAHVPDGWSERDLWAAYRDAYAPHPHIQLALDDTPPLPSSQVRLQISMLDRQEGLIQVRGMLVVQRSRARSLELAWEYWDSGS